MKKNTVVKFFIGLLLGLVLIALVAFNALLIWVATGPRQIDQITPMLEAAIIDKESGLSLKIAQTWLIWDGWQHPIDIQLKQVQLLTRSGQVFSDLPQISLGLDPIGLAFGQILPASLVIKHPIISLKQEADKSINFGLGKHTNTEDALASDIPAAMLIESLINPQSSGSLHKLRRVELVDADVTIGNETDGVVMHLPNLDFYVKRESSDAIMGNINSTAQYNDMESAIDGNFAYNKNRKRLEGLLNFSKLNVSELAKIFTNNSPAKGLEIIANGQSKFALNIGGELESLQIKLDGGKGKLHSEKLAKTIEFSSVKLEGEAKNNLQNFSLAKAEINFSGSLMKASGSGSRSEDGLAISGEASINEVATDQIPQFWPPSLAPLTREWVTTNISDGGITKASVKIDIKAGDLDLPELPAEAIDAQIDLKDAKIRYLPNHPQISNVNAHIKVDGKALDAAISNANGLTNTKLSNGRVYIADLNPDNPLLEVSMNADSPANDLVTLLGLPLLEHAKHLNLDASKVSGKASGFAKLTFYFFANDPSGKETPVTVDIKAKAENISSPALLRRFDIKNATGDFTITDKEILFNGDGNVNGANLTGSQVHYWFTPIDGVDTIIKANGKANQEVLNAFGVTPPVKINGDFGLSFDGKFGPEKEDISAALDLTGSEVILPEINFTKPVGEAANFNVVSTVKGGITQLTSLEAKGASASFSGSAALAAGGKELGAMDLSGIKLGKTTLKELHYAKNENGMDVAIKGDALDISGTFKKEDDGGFSFEQFPALNLSLDIDSVIAANNISLSAVKGTLACDVIRCKSADIRGNIDTKNFSFAITNNGKKRALAITAEDAGNLLRALDIEKSMYGGRLTITGNYEDTKTDSTLRGNADIQDYTLKDAPVLAKLLSLTSLTGFFDTLTGQGIAFKKLQAPFTLQNDVITLKDAKTYGSAIGLMAEGTITFPSSTLDLRGTIVPSYTLNSVVGKVPLLGDILTGGGGNGVFAARYTIKGDSKEPEVSVNPLSILTPGFLRNMFDVF